MTININKEDAEKIILESFRDECKTKDKITQNIEEILSASHKTYKYILVTGVLAKATNEKANPIALQAGAEIVGAYDARSLCHNVLVPFERDFLHNILGGSNEPFLNKPARFTHLSKDNAVRRGRDKEILLLLIETLSAIHNSKQAKQYLACAFKFLESKIEEASNNGGDGIDYNPTLIEIYEFAIKFIEKAQEGETCAIVIGTLEAMLHESYNVECTVKTHKVNQCGASSKEVGDIDVFINKKFSHAIEVKDKSFTPYDLEHAFKKIIENHGTKGAFIFGPHAKYDNKAISLKIRQIEAEGFFVLFTSAQNYIKDTLFKMPPHSKEYFTKTLFRTAKEVNCKESTIEWIHSLMDTINWIE